MMLQVFCREILGMWSSGAWKLRGQKVRGSQACCGTGGWGISSRGRTCLFPFAINTLDDVWINLFCGRWALFGGAIGLGPLPLTWCWNLMALGAPRLLPFRLSSTPRRSPPRNLPWLSEDQGDKTHVGNVVFFKELLKFCNPSVSTGLLLLVVQNI